MLATSRTLSLIEQKKLQWAKEREEMVGMYGLWGRPRNLDKIESKISVYNKSNPLPPIEGKAESEDQFKAEESETSGYLSDSPQHLNGREINQKPQYVEKSNEELNNETSHNQKYWNEVKKEDQENYWVDKKMYKNINNENWAHNYTDSVGRQRFYQSNRNFWHGTPDSLSSDEGSRLRWGDRGVGIGHLWEPAVNYPDCRLPLVAGPYRPTPKWVEKGLKNANGNNADILIIHHPDDAEYDPPQKNYLLGQNAPIPPEVIEEREQRRKKALEHQNAIKKQLEEREIKRKQEKENKLREEKLEEERIKREQEIEKLRYEDEQRKMKKKEEIEKKKEEIMKEAIALAEKRAKEEKKLNKKYLLNNTNCWTLPENENKLEKVTERSERISNYQKQGVKTPRYKKAEESAAEEKNCIKKEKTEKSVKDSFSQIEDIQLAQNFQFLNMNGLPVEGGLALMLDNNPKDGNFLLSPEGVQLALLVSPRTATATNRLMQTTPSVPASRGEKILTPSKYRIAERTLYDPINKSTQTDLKYSSAEIKTPGLPGKGKKLNRRSGTHSGSSGSSQKFYNERINKHVRCFLFSKYRTKTHSTKSLEDRPKWGINRPSVQYKKQSEKDPYYQKKMKERLKKAEVEILCFGSTESGGEKEKEMNSVIRFLECQSDEDEKQTDKANKEVILLQNGYRMNSNLSSPVFVPLGRSLSEQEKAKGTDAEIERNSSNDLEKLQSGENQNAIEDEENAAVPGSVGFLTQTQLEAIRQIASLREVY